MRDAWGFDTTRAARSEPEGVEKVALISSMAGELSPIEALALRPKGGIATHFQGELVCRGAHDSTPFGVRPVAETLGSDMVHLECSIEREGSLARMKSALSASPGHPLPAPLSLSRRTGATRGSGAAVAGAVRAATAGPGVRPSAVRLDDA